jgi:hypothetical protein
MTITVIHLHRPQAQCCICGEWDLSHWGVPVDDTGLIVANDYAGEWSGKPVCRDCWAKHEGGEFVGDDPRF